ncbi:MAG: twin-arginine translocation signal domain-containing protein [Cyclobacteriaceae bacterium]
MKKSRRDFLATVGVASAGLALTGMNVKQELMKAKKGFETKIYATKWGFKGSSIDEFCKQVKVEGYDGVENWLPNDEAQIEAFFEALEKYDLSCGILCSSSGNTFEKHLSSYSKKLEQAISKNPDFINCHTGKDFFSFEENKQLIDIGIKLSEDSNIPIYQETHRGRMLFAAHICEKYIDTTPELKLTLDISHWCAVSESLLGDQQETVYKALTRTGHIHSRIGHEEGPQVPEPRAPEWKKAKDAHYAWWDKVVALKKEAGEVLTMTAEFGPPNYMWTNPHTYQPVADQWAINVHMMNEWRKRYL